MIAEMQGSENTRGLAALNKERRRREPQRWKVGAHGEVSLSIRG